MAAAFLALASAPSSVHAAASNTPRLFLNCTTECFEPYLRQELSYFDLVRDRHQARHELLISAQPAGSGGMAYSVTLFTRDAASPRALAPRTGKGSSPAAPASGSPAATAEAPTTTVAVRKLMRPPARPLAEFRAELLDAVLRLLYVALSATPHESQFKLTLPSRSPHALGQLDDPWDYWVLIPELEGEGEAGSGYYFAEVGGNITIRRITDRHKLRSKLSYWQSISSFELQDESSIEGNVHGIEASVVYARSVARHYAVGLTSNLRSSKFENLALHTHFGPVFEANVYPYSENASRQLRFVYQAGVWYNDYFELNAAGNGAELLHYHAVSAIVDLNQPWGSVQMASQLNSFLERPSLFRLALGGQLTLLLFEGLSLTLEGKSAWVRDQVNVRQRSLTDSEILLFTAEQPTRFALEAGFGFSYAFGSVLNTIVNPRFGQVDLNEE